LLGEAKATAERELREARTALSALPNTRSVSPLADKLGLPAWTLDLLAAALASLSVNLLGATLIAFAAHGKHRLTLSPVLDSVEPMELIAPPPPVSTREHAANFIATCLHRDPSSKIHARDLHAAYLEYCRALAETPRSDIGVELAVLLRALGLKMAPDQSIGGARLVADVQRRLASVLDQTLDSRRKSSSVCET